MRIAGMVLRLAYIYRRSIPRVAEIFYWPVVNVLLFAFFALYLRRIENPSVGLRAASAVVGAILLWDILSRAQQSVSMSFLEDVWSRNLLNVFVTPISPIEYVTGAIVVGIIRVAITTTVASLIGWAISGFNILTIGFALGPFALNLIAMGWTIGIITIGMILYYGEGAEVLAWALAMVFQPLGAVFFPVSVLPQPFRAIAHGIPSAHVFEGMRTILAGGPFPYADLALATALNLLYLAAALAFFAKIFDVVRRRGLLSRFGE